VDRHAGPRSRLVHQPVTHPSEANIGARTDARTDRSCAAAFDGDSRSRSLVAPRSIGQVPYQEQTLPAERSRPDAGQHPCRQTVRSGSQS